MLYRKLTSDGDYTFGNNSFDFIDGDEAIAQAIKTKLLLFYGEWFESVTTGIPMFQGILGQTSNENLKMTITLICTERIQEVKGVISVDSIEIEIDNRELKIQIDVTTENGTQTSVEVNF